MRGLDIADLLAQFQIDHDTLHFDHVGHLHPPEVNSICEFVLQMQLAVVALLRETRTELACLRAAVDKVQKEVHSLVQRSNQGFCDTHALDWRVTGLEQRVDDVEQLLRVSATVLGQVRR